MTTESDERTAPVPTARPKMKLGHVCPECGTAGWMHRDAQRQADELVWKRRDIEKMARENGLLRYKLAVAEEVEQRRVSSLMSKIDKQRKAIRRLEEKLRDRGERPYEGTGGSEAPR